MAIKWISNITVLDAKRKNVSVSLEQIDDADPKNVKVLKRYAVLDALIDTPERKQQIFDELKRQHDAEKQKITDDEATIGTLADDITIAAEGWEAK